MVKDLDQYLMLSRYVDTEAISVLLCNQSGWIRPKRPKLTVDWTTVPTLPRVGVPVEWDRSVLPIVGRHALEYQQFRPAFSSFLSRRVIF